MPRILPLLGLLAALGCATSASAQGLNNLLNGLLNSGQRAQQQQAARDAWSKTDPDIVACLERTLQPPPSKLAEGGIGPGDPRISQYVNNCARQVTAERTRRQQEQQQAEELQRRHALEAERQRAQAEARVKADAEKQRVAAEAKAKAEAEESRHREEATKLRSDPALVAVLGKDARDITVLVASSDTQNVIRNMKGDPVFQRPAVACLPFGSTQPVQGAAGGYFGASVKAQVERAGGGPANPIGCQPKDIGKYDLVIFSAGQIAAASSDGLSPLVQALTANQLTSLAVYSVADFEAEEQTKKAGAEAAEQQRQAERQAAREAFEARDAATYSAIYSRQPAAVVCVLKENGDGLRYLLKRPDSPYIDVIAKTASTREAASPDNIFISLKKNECSAAVAPSGALRDVAKALARDKIEITVHKGTIEPDRVARWKDLENQDRVAGGAPAPAAPQPAVSPAFTPAAVVASQPAPKPTAAQAEIVPASVTDKQGATQSSEPKPLLPQCDDSVVAMDYYVASCVMRGLELQRQSDSVAEARSRLDNAGKALECAPESMAKVTQFARQSASQILSSNSISKLMDFNDAINVECKKAASARLH